MNNVQPMKTYTSIYYLVIIRRKAFGLTHWGRVTHICVSQLNIIGSDNGLSVGRRQAIIWTNAGILLIGPLGTNFSEIFIEIFTFSFKLMHLKMSGIWRSFPLGLNVLTQIHEWVKHIMCTALTPYYAWLYHWSNVNRHNIVRYYAD